MDHTTPDSEAIPETLRLLFEVQHRMRQHFETIAAEFELSPQQGRALRRIAIAAMEADPGEDHGVTMGDVADHLACDASNVTGLVDRLEERGLVRREADPGDRRRRLLVLTEEGWALGHRMRARLLEDRPGIAGLDPDELERLRQLLAKSLQHFPGRSPEAGQ